MSTSTTQSRMLRFVVEHADGTAEAVSVPVAAVYNFGYAARDQAGLREHLDAQAARGAPVPTTVPAIFPVVVDRVCADATLCVVGDESYAEVEYALVHAGAHGWLITVASDHSDGAVERHDVPRGKNMTADVVATRAWRLADVAERVDELELTCVRCAGADEEVVQRDRLATVLAPAALLEILERRLGREPGPGTVVLSGTIGGEPQAGADGWRVALRDPVSARALTHAYAVTALPPELHEPTE